jgi:hypothetical protein
MDEFLGPCSCVGKIRFSPTRSRPMLGVHPARGTKMTSPMQYPAATDLPARANMYKLVADAQQDARRLSAMLMPHTTDDGCLACLQAAGFRTY